MNILRLVILLLFTGLGVAAQSQTGAGLQVATITLLELYEVRTEENRVYRLAENPRLLVFDFADLVAQGDALNRMAAFLEKRGGNGRVLDDVQLASRIAAEGREPSQFYLGHDYRLTSAAHFFNVARSQGIVLNTGEQEVLSTLLASGLLVSGPQGLAVREDNTAFISVSQARAQSNEHHTNLDDRTILLRHELSHGEFFTNLAYRDYCHDFWEGLTPEEREIFRQELALLGYEPTDEELMINEMQAYLWEPAVAGFLQARLIKQGSQDLAGFRQRFLAGLTSRPHPVTAFFDLPRHLDLLPAANVSGRTLVISKIGDIAALISQHE